MPAISEDTPRGLGFAVSAYLLWGFLPLYLKLVAHIGPVEVVAHRILWSVPVAFAVLVALNRTRELTAALRNPRMLAMSCLTAALITINWGIYVWAISNERALDAALGYYINPLFSMALGALMLGERVARAQVLAIALAAAAVIVLTLAADSIPWASAGLTISWGFYALFKKQLPIGANQGFLLEVLILAPPALAYLAWLGGSGRFGMDARDTALLMGCGVVTATPLMLYANGAKALKLTTIAILQYIAPTMIFLVAVFIFGETVDTPRLIAFPMIWAALAIYSVSLIRQLRRD